MRSTESLLLSKQVSLYTERGSGRVADFMMTSYKKNSPLNSDLARGSLENLYDKIRSDGDPGHSSELVLQRAED